MMGRRRMTGARLAAVLGVSPAWVSYRLSGKQPIDLNDLELIASVLGVSVIALIPQTEPTNVPVPPLRPARRESTPRYAQRDQTGLRDGRPATKGDRGNTEVVTRPVRISRLAAA